MLWVFGCQACGILAPLQGTEATPCAERRSLNRWTAREVPPGHFRAVKTETHKGGVIWAKLPGARGIALSNIPQGSKIVTFQKRAGALITRETCYIHCEHKSQLFILGVKSRAKFSSQEGGRKKKKENLWGLWMERDWDGWHCACAFLGKVSSPHPSHCPPSTQTCCSCHL